MSTSLHDRLADLAGDAPSGGPDPDLWDRGRRYGRRRRVGTVVITAVVVVLLAAVATVGWVRAPHDVPPAKPGGELALPDRLYVPSPWLPGTDETGPIGPVVALVPAQRGVNGSGVAAVSTTGAYAFLDLADMVGESAVAVSPDGRRVAYLLTGETSGGPDVSRWPDPVVGVGVYDTVTGDTERYEVPSEHGLLIDQLAWGGTTLWFDYLFYAGAGDEGHARADLDEVSGLAWDLDDGTQRTFTGRTMPALYGATSGSGALVTVDGRRLTTSTITEPERRGGRFDARVETTAFIDPTVGRVAVMADTDDPDVASNQAEPLVTAVPGPDGLTTRRVPGKRIDVLLGWRDEGHVVVQRYREHDGAYLELDVVTGETEPLMSGFGTIPQDVWQAPQFDAPPPPEPMSPTARTALTASGVAAVVVGVLALVVWRRRVRP